MFSDSLKQEMEREDRVIGEIPSAECHLPMFYPEMYYADVANKRYFRCLVAIRHAFKRVSDEYFCGLNAKNIDLFMLTSSISSPMGPGSDSEAIAITFGALHTYLVDSAQFGFEPLLMNSIDKAYCYLPSMRGEDPDKRHLNQFYHCEYEGVGNLEHVMDIVEGYIKELCDAFLLMPKTLKRLSNNQSASMEALQAVRDSGRFRRITFDDAVSMLEKAGFSSYINYKEHGRDIRADGESALMNIIGENTPLWITGYDRDRVPFYQKPDPKDDGKILNADLIFPALTPSSLGGEIVGAGQRQDSAEEMFESMKRQNIDSAPYEWYAKLRQMPGYRTTSGFGLGVERFIAWLLCLEDIRDASLYPRLKNTVTIP